MADTLKVLFQSYPSGGTLTAGYTVPGATSAVVSTVTVANQSTTPTSFRLSVAIAGAADAQAQYVAYDIPLAGNETRALTLGISLAATDVLRVYSANGTVSFNGFGVEVT